MAMGDVYYVMREGRRIAVRAINYDRAKAKKATEAFAKVPLWWIELAAKATRSPRTFVLIELLYTAWRMKSGTFPFPSVKLKQRGASREIKRRVLHDLEQAKLITVERRPHKAPVVTLLLL
jgi:hypothetical protein